MTEVKRKKGESFEGLLRRFNGRVQKSGRLIQAKKIRFAPESENTTKKKAKALKRVGAQKKIKYFLKTGKISEDDLKKRGRNRLRINKIK